MTHPFGFDHGDNELHHFIDGQGTWRRPALEDLSDNPWKFGGASDYLQISRTTGTLRLFGAATAWDDIQPYYTGGQGPSVAGDAQYGSTGFYWKRFTDNHGMNEQVQYGFQLPHRWKEGTSAQLHLHIVPSANGAAGNEDVVLRVKYQWVNIGAGYSTTTNTEFNTTFRVGAADANTQKIWAPAALSGSGKTISSDLMVIIARQSQAESGTDNYTGDIWLRYVDLHLEIDSLGSDEVLTKNES